MALNFSDLKAGYPTADKTELFRSMGGQWPSLIDSEEYKNTCAIRVSLALKSAGYTIPGKFREAMTGDGTTLIIKVATMGRFLGEAFGPSNWGMSKNPGSTVDPSVLPKKSGILVYHAAWQNATGHFDLWTGSSFVGSGNFDDIKVGYDLALWFVQ